jgi:hypothetical protein
VSLSLSYVEPCCECAERSTLQIQRGNQYVSYSHPDNALCLAVWRMRWPGPPKEAVWALRIDRSRVLQKRGEYHKWMVMKKLAQELLNGSSLGSLEGLGAGRIITSNDSGTRALAR